MPGKFPNKFVVEFEAFHKLNWRERLKIFFGYNVKVRAKAVLNCREGSCRQRCDVTLTKELTPEDQSRADITETP